MSNGGTPVPQSPGITAGGTIALPVPPTKDGYYFAGWFFDNGAFQIAFTSSTVITRNITVYARWFVPGTFFTVSFNTHGGNSIEAQQITEGQTATRPANNPARTDHYFMG